MAWVQGYTSNYTYKSKKVFVIMLSDFSPGLFFILPCIDKFTSVDVRIKSFDVPPQKVRRYCVYGMHEMAVLCYTPSSPSSTLTYPHNMK